MFTKQETPAKQAGFKIGDKAVILESGAGFYAGQIVEFNYDDGSSQPMFSGPNDRYRLAFGPYGPKDSVRVPGAYISLSRVERIVPEPQKITVDVCHRIVALDMELGIMQSQRDTLNEMVRVKQEELNVLMQDHGVSA